ncbi:MAG: hypothetical protein A9Z00_08495 [Thermobacillus sp. ZCTH02-B1]|uniref:ABC transporter ATP-binding protein n=1 Tax=Thermobacillus sp. ZCTH02-B1 TaxID=1858795 RepID=UPI000B551080|nr:ABC transporter ATP-binding protein [Thermobacillus sp. ZCTH02-B1]OUM95381.1 MAG: hypothetical protein A9Z00_08495 [Thermobacillus sp. ZCTH02-B1]
MVDTTPSMTAGRGEAGRAEVFVALLRWVRRYTPHYVALALIVGAASLIPVGQAEALRRVFNAVYEGSVPLLRQAAVYFGAVFFGGLIVQIARTWLSQRLYNRSTLELQREVLRRMFRLDLRLLNRWHVGDQIQRIGDSAVAAQDGVNRQIPALIERLLSVLLLIVYLTVQSWQLMAVALAVALLMPMVSNLLAGPIYREQSRANEARAEQDALLQDQMQGAETVRAFQLRERFNLRWLEVVRRSFRHRLRGHLWMAASGFSIFLGYWLGIAYIFIAGALQFAAGAIDIGVIAAFVISYEHLVRPLSHLTNIWAAVQNALAHAARVFEIADPAAPLEKPPAGAERLLPDEGDLVLDRVTFGYDPAQPVLRELSLTVRRGTVTALVGPSGQGKSTLLKLIMGLYAPDSGAVLLGGVPIDERTMADWRRRAACVPQDIGLFDATVADNIRAGRTHLQDEALAEAARLARADGFIGKLPEGYATRLGERGQTLSGGERQRLAIARACARNPEFLLLDEPTSALDGENERLLQETLRSLMAGRTVIVAAHRLSTVRHADRIVVIDEGRVVESGTHDELMALGGRYAELVRAGTWADRAEATASGEGNEP